MAGGRPVSAHRIALFLKERPSHFALFSLHACDNRACCNPKHLRWGTCKENAADRTARNKQWRTNNRIARQRIGALQRKLLPSQLDYVKKLVAGGYSKRQCARWYKVTHTTINRLLRACA